MSDPYLVSSDQAFLAMYRFLECWSDANSKPEELSVLLGAMSLDREGKCADPAVSQIWKEALDAAITGSVDAKLRFVSAPNRK